jgi:cell division protease FtsH
VPGNDPLHKVTIIPRGRALGVTMNLPERDRYGFKKSELEAKLAMMFGGRVAEELIYGPANITTGAGNDIQQATNMARAMVTEYGMSEKLGPLRYNDNQEEIFLGHSVARTQNVSGATAKIIDEEIRRIIEEAETLARKVLNEHMDGLHKIASGVRDPERRRGRGPAQGRGDRPLGARRADRRQRPALLGTLQRQARQRQGQGQPRWSGAGTPAGNLSVVYDTALERGPAFQRGLVRTRLR